MTLPFWQPWLIPILPLVGALLNGLFGKRLSNSVVAAIALLGDAGVWQARIEYVVINAGGRRLLNAHTVAVVYVVGRQRLARRAGGEQAVG